ncbi:MAG: class I SAM-dependent methyltransferase [Candidatus Syntrophopropionicum ammoniitolerans]
MVESIENKTGLSMTFFVTTSLGPTSKSIGDARELAAFLNVAYVARRDQSIKNLTALYPAEGVLVVSSQKISFLIEKDKIFFHPGLALPRIKEINNGKTDQMISALSLQEGDSVLDCTMGLGTDAIVASYITGSRGTVTGLECSPIISELVKRGLQSYQIENEKIMLAMRRIKVIKTKHKVYLASLKTGSYDVVYFDPMFRYPGRKSSGINTLRILANHDPIDHETIKMAYNAAAKRVVIKERRGSTEFARLGFKNIMGGRHSTVAYGIKERERWNERIT